MRIPYACLTLLAATAAAQNYVVSPAYCAVAEGGSNNTIPFWGTTGYYRYQQPMSDLKGTPRVFTEIAWRRDGQLGTTASYAARTIDMEISLADTDMATFSTTFASNYFNPPVNVFLRRMVNTPDHTTQPPVLPAPWTFALPFDTPFVYSGVKDLLYDITCHSFTTMNSYPLDATSGATPSAIGGFTSNGTGCTTANGQMTLRATFTISSSANSLALVWNVLRGPASATSAILVGIADPNAPIPGLCGMLHTDGTVLNISGTTSTAGTLNTPVVTLTPYNPAWAGFPLTAQAASVDATQTGLPVAVSNGITSRIPPLPTATPSHRLYSSTLNALTGTLGTSFSLPTRFRY